MKRFWIHGVAALSLIGAASACSQNALGPVAVTKNDSVVVGCQKVGEVTVSSSTAERDVMDRLTAAARHQGGNYVLVSADGARNGTAYRCTTPSPAAPASGS